MGGSRTVLPIPKDLALSSDSSWLPHQSMYNSQCLLHGLASSQLPGRWLAALSSLCHASPPSGPSSQLLCWATLTLAGSPVTSPPATLSSSSLFLFNLGGHFTLYPVPKILPASSLPAPPLLPPPVATQLPGLPSTAGTIMAP